MVAGSRTLTTLLFALAALMTVSFAQESGEACSSRETVYPRLTVPIREEARYSGALVRFAAVGERLDIIGSKREGPRCWLQLAEGWITDNLLLLGSARRSDAPGSCFAGERAFISGNVNIRSGASTEYRVVASARAGDVLTVSDSTLGATWCWLKIDRGWMAKTTRVRSTKPAQAVVTSSAGPAAALPENIDNCCFVDRECRTEQEWTDGYWAFQNNECSAPSQGPVQSSNRGRPRLEGSPAFIRLIQRALDLLEARSTHWYRYVVDQTSVIIEGDPFGPGICGAHVYARERRVTVDTDCLTWDTVTIASILVHEACHVFHHDNNITYPEGQLREEWECSTRDVLIALGASNVRQRTWEEYVEWMRTEPFD